MRDFFKFVNQTNKRKSDFFVFKSSNLYTYTVYGFNFRKTFAMHYLTLDHLDTLTSKKRQKNKIFSYIRELVII